MKYIKQLDAVRAIAVLLVIISHWIPREYLISRVPTGELGVDIFFVLSGFLITWILLANREKARIENAGRGQVIKNFYIRRSLRIFPIYYFVVLTMLIFSEKTGTSIETSYPYYLTYTSNYYFFDIKGWDGILSHLWSLSVEEQFYILWPSIMLFSGRKLLPYIIGGFILIGIGTQVLLRGVGMSNILTPACFDAFGMGALLSWIIVHNPGWLGKFYRYLKIVAPFAFMLFVISCIQTRWHIFPLIRTINSILALTLITFILYRIQSGKSIRSFILNNKMFIFLGKISYGIYLYHLILPYVVSQFAGKYFGINLQQGIGLAGYFILNLVLVVAVSWLSWMLIEKPILSLKAYFEYTSSKRKVVKPVLENGYRHYKENS